MPKGKMEKFCREYILDYDAMRAALRAGYSESSARSYAFRLLKREDVLERICELQGEYIRKNLLDDKNRVIREIWDIYQRSIQAKPVTVWDKELREYVETGEYQFDDKVAMKCLEFIIKLGGMLSEKEEPKEQKDSGCEIVFRVEKDEE